MPKVQKVIFALNCVLILSLMFISISYAKTVTVQNRQLYVDGNPFNVKGVTYGSLPIGKFNYYEGNTYCTFLGDITGIPPDDDSLFIPTNPEDNLWDCSDPDWGAEYTNTDVLVRDMEWISQMNANTVRIFGDATPQLMTEAAQKGLMVMAGYWIDDIDYVQELALIEDGDPATKSQVLEDFKNYVTEFKDYDSLLMWGLTNENNMRLCQHAEDPQTCDMNAQATALYKFLNHLAAEAKAIDPNHPVIMISADFYYTPYYNPVIHLYNNATVMPDIDLIGINYYGGENFDGLRPGDPNLFNEFESYFPDKPIVVTEFGTDSVYTTCTNISENDPNAPDPDNYPDICLEYTSEIKEDLQSQYIDSSWDDINNHLVNVGGPCVGGVVFHFDDHWSFDWYYSWTPSVASHDYRWMGYPTIYPDTNSVSGANPDGLQNMEWQGIMSREQNLDGTVCDTPAGIDCLSPKLAYYTLQEKFACTDADGDGYYAEGASCSTAPDCNDSDASIHPGAAEIQDDNDSNCDGYDFRIPLAVPQNLKLSTSNGVLSWSYTQSNNIDGFIIEMQIKENNVVTIPWYEALVIADPTRRQYPAPTYGVSVIKIKNGTQKVYYRLRAYADDSIANERLKSNASNAVPPSFIATAAYRDEMAKEVDTLRTFRNTYLLTNPLGRAFVNWYYRYSPPAAKYISDKPELRKTVRGLLKPLVWMSEQMTKKELR